MQCEQIMKRDVHCVAPLDSVEEAARLMRDENIGFLPVCEPHGKVVGTLTDRDIAIRLVATNKPASTTVQDVMTRDVVSCHPKDDVRKAERLMAQLRKSRIMCIDESGQLCGVISLSDIAEHERDRKQVSDTLRDITQREARA